MYNCFKWISFTMITSVVLNQITKLFMASRITPKTINLKNLGAIILVPLLFDRHLSINSTYVGSKTMPKVICLKLGYPNLS